MKFDASRAESLFRELGDTRYAGPDGEAKVADFVASQFEEMGLNVERRQVAGSRLPQRVAPWVGWVGYGLLLTTVYLLLSRTDLPSTILAFALAFLSFLWLNAAVSGRIRPGRGWPPVETVPLVIASLRDSPPSPVRVVFQAVLGGLRPRDWRSLKRDYRLYSALRNVTLLLFFGLLGCRIYGALGPDQARPTVIHAKLMRFMYPGVLALVWIVIAGRLSRELRSWRGVERLPLAERRGLSLVLELARTWPRTGSRPIEPIFVAAGGQQLDHAGSREVIRLLRSNWPSRPSLLILFFAPGAGEKLGLFTIDSPESELHQVAQGAAQSLWIPIQDNTPFLSLPFWPLEDFRPAVVLIGSDPRSLQDDSVDPQALHRAAQLAIEITLRWARQQSRAAPPPGSAA